MAKAMQDKAGAKWGIGLQAGGDGVVAERHAVRLVQRCQAQPSDGKSYNFDTPEMQEAVKYYQSYFTDGIADKAAPATPTTEPDFVSGKVPMFISGPWEMSAVEKVGGKGFKDKYSRRGDARRRRPPPPSSVAPTSRSSRTPSSATPPGSS